MKKICRCLFLVVISSITTGCTIYVPEQKLYNNTGRDLAITLKYYSNDERIFTLENRQSALIGEPYKIKVETADITWRYNDQGAPLKFHKCLGRRRWLATLQIQKNGTIYLLSPDSVAPAESFPPQPAEFEFPLEPEK